MTIDPYERAAKAQLRPREFWGQVQIDAWLCVLVMGKGKVPFDPAQHREDRACTALNIAVLPLPEQNITFPIERELIAESNEWIKIVWPSLRQFDLETPKDAKGKWCRARFVPTGRTYTNANGEEKEATTFEFLALYDSEDACRAAYLEGSNNPAADHGSGGETGTAVNDPERHTALEFVKVLAKAHGGDAETLAAEMAKMPLIAKHFSIDSPEVQELLTENIPF